ncbi:MAG: peptide chain release factor 2 [Clostridia bacterium]|nr:peptide chain release factor 2 [Clostridia bacterium]
MIVDDIRQQLSNIQKSLELIQAVFDINKLQQEYDEIIKKQAEPDYYNDMKMVQATGKRLVWVESTIKRVVTLVRRYNDIVDTLAELTDEDDLWEEMNEEVDEVAKLVEELRLSALLRGKYDSGDAILTIQAGAGGTEAQDWAEMLLRMYTRYADKRGYKVTVIDNTPGDGAGIKGATILISGANAYGYLKAEKGVHRLVRISPFDSNARRHTSFASVEVMPEIENSDEIEIKDSDLKIDTFHAGGCGGQGVNTTDSAVRIRHIPTGIVVTCQNQRSQIQNREFAMNVLRGKLAQLQEEQQQKDIKEVQGTLKKIEWGSQIRNYVFCPYTLVKDLRTDYETSNVGAVMDGDIQEFINEYLKKSEA